jgi:hypothetical protein
VSCWLLLAVSAVLSYMLWNGQFPPRISPRGSDLPVGEVGDTGAALDLLETSLRESQLEFVGSRVNSISRGERGVG